MTFLQHEVFHETLYQWNIILKTLETGRKSSRMGGKHDGIEARRESPKLDETLISILWKFSMKPKDREIFTAKPDIWEEWWRPGHAERHVEHEFSIDFESAPREGSVQLKVNQVKISSDGKQVNMAIEGERNKVIDLEQVSSFDDQVEVLSRVSSGPRVQISRSSARYFAGKSKNCPEANGGYVRVQSSQDVHLGFWLSPLR
ncbi:hypothetical protein F2Q70_00020893 [Brassica cretica]|uniref:Uncharacterized protein n=1 Tax=Brassica cretica TaxID=69181 RepID=A0A8S9GNG9_BRACR|nr:hypothetical protein F2Q70_00020893 [Brassica cretica]